MPASWEGILGAPLVEFQVGRLRLTFASRGRAIASVPARLLPYIVFVVFVAIPSGALLPFGVQRQSLLVNMRMFFRARAQILGALVGVMRHLSLAHLFAYLRCERAVELSAEFALLSGVAICSVVLASFRVISSNTS